MIRRTDVEIKSTIKAEYGAMHEAGCNSRIISKAITGKYNPRLIIESIQEYNDARLQKV